MLVQILVQRDQIHPWHACLGHHDASHRLLELFVGGRERQTLLHRRMLHHSLFDLEGGNGLASSVDDLLGTTGDEQVALFVEMAHVTGVEPSWLAVDDEERLIVGATVVLVPSEAGGSAHQDVPLGAHGHHLDAPSLHHLVDVGDLDLGAHGDARGTCGVQAIRLGRGRDGHALGHAVTSEYHCSESHSETLRQHRQQSTRRVGDEPDGSHGQGQGSSLRLHEDGVMHRGGSVVPCGAQ